MKMEKVLWGAVVKPGKPYKHQYNEDLGRLHISQAILAPGQSGMKSLIVVSDAGHKNPLLLCSLSPERIHTCPLNLELEEDDDVTFSVIGPRCVYLIGFYLTPTHAFDWHVSEDKSDKLMMEDGTNGELKDDGSQGFLDDDNDYALPISTASRSKSIVDNAVPEGTSNEMVTEDGTKEREDDEIHAACLKVKMRALYQDNRYKWVAGSLVFSDETDSESGEEYKKKRNEKNDKGKTSRIKTRAGGHDSSKVEMKKRGKEVNACSNDNNRPSKRAAIIEVMDQDPCEPNANLLDDKSFDRSVVLAGADGQNEH